MFQNCLGAKRISPKQWMYCRTQTNFLITANDTCCYTRCLVILYSSLDAIYALSTRHCTTETEPSSATTAAHVLLNKIVASFYITILKFFMFAVQDEQNVFPQVIRPGYTNKTLTGNNSEEVDTQDNYYSYMSLGLHNPAYTCTCSWVYSNHPDINSEHSGIVLFC